MAADISLDALLAKLQDPHQDLNLKTKNVQELRDSLDVWAHGGPQIYASFLQKSLPVFIQILGFPTVFESAVPEQKLRYAIFEVLQRLPLTADVPDALIVEVVDFLLGLIETENEENDILIIKTLMQFMTHNPKLLRDQIQKLLDTIYKMFELLPGTVQDVFNSSKPPPPLPTPNHTSTIPPHAASPAAASNSALHDLGPEQQVNRVLARGVSSFRVLAECPIVIVGLFTCGDKTIAQRNLKTFVAQIKNTLTLQAPPQEKAHQEAAARGDIHTGVCKAIKDKSAFGDFIVMQVKTMSFLAYLLRAYSGQLADFLEILPDIMVRMLKDCPRERSAARKELLVALKHMSYSFTKAFLGVLDDLLDSRILLGDGLTVYENLRPLAYSMLADLIHNLRGQLNQSQIRTTIQVYTRNFLDEYPGTSFQIMSAKLLTNMSECIAKLEDKKEARHFFMLIFTAIADKFAAMNHQFNNAVKVSKQFPVVISTGELVSENYLMDTDDIPTWDEISIYNATPIKTQAPKERTSNPVNDLRFLLKNLILGLKSLFYVLKHTNPAPLLPEIEDIAFPLNWSDISFGFSAEEVKIFIRLFHEGMKAFKYFDPTGEQFPTDVSNYTAAELLATQYQMHGSKEEKELLETFGTVFHCVDPATFHEIFTSEIPHLYDMCFIHPPVLHIAQYILASEATSPGFCGMLLNFLMAKLEQVGDADVKKASSLLRLFKLSFMAVTLFAPKNESVLRPHVKKIVTQSIRLATTAQEPVNYFVLLRSLFRSIGGGKFESLYKEILPLLEMILDVLNGLLHAARKPTERDLYVELILSVPARLSNLLPHLSFLMRPLIVALTSDEELVGQGLRTVELCVDNFTEAYIDPIMEPVINELIAAICSHLRPAPYSTSFSHKAMRILGFSHKAMRILGKLSGRNRRHMDNINQLDYKLYSDDDASYGVKLIGSNRKRYFPAKIGIDLTINKFRQSTSKMKEHLKHPLAKTNEVYYKREAFRFIQAQIKLSLGLEALPDNFAQLVKQQASNLLQGKYYDGAHLLNAAYRTDSLAKRDAQQDILKKLIQACHFATSIDYLREEADSLLLNLCNHFALLELGKAAVLIARKHKKFEPDAGQEQVYIDSKVMVDAITGSLASDVPAERCAAESSILRLWESSALLLGDRSQIDILPTFKDMVSSFTHNCYQPEWYAKMSGVLGLKLLVTKLSLPDEYWMSRHIQIVRALMFVLKDMSPDQTALPRVEAEATLHALIAIVAKHFKREDLDKKGDSNEKRNENSDNKEANSFRVLNVTLIQDLSHSNPNARLAVQKVYKLLSDIVDIPIADILRPSQEHFLTSIFIKPIRSIPLGHRIGCLDALKFCLKLQGQIVLYDDKLDRLINEVVLLLDAKAENLSVNPLEYRNAELIVQLRSCCMKLLATVITSPENMLLTPKSAMWNQLIVCFFKWLYDRNPDTVDSAQDALKAVMSVNPNLPKEVLHNGLKPILQSLKDAETMSMEHLEGLSKLLKLLTVNFRVEIGQKLIEHTKGIVSSADLQEASFTLLSDYEKTRRLAALFNVFHVLPPTADRYLRGVIERILDLESSLRRTQSSTFRIPLIRFMNLYPTRTAEYFYPKLQELKYGRFFAQILAHEEAQLLRAAVYNDADRLLQEFSLDANERAKLSAEKAIQEAQEQTQATDQPGTQPADSEEHNSPPLPLLSSQEITKLKLVGLINAIHIASSLSQFPDTRDFLGKNEALCRSLFLSGDGIEQLIHNSENRRGNFTNSSSSPDMAINNEIILESSLRLAADQARDQLADLLVLALEQNLNDLDFFFEIVDSVSSRRLKLTPSFTSFIYKHMVCSNDLNYVVTVVKESIDTFLRPSVCHKMKAFIFHFVVNPIFAYDIQRNWKIPAANGGTPLLDASMLKTLFDKIWIPHSLEMADEFVEYVDYSRQELLQFTALLLKYHGKFLYAERKDILRFVWDWLKLEDVASKYSAYVVVSYFIAFYDTPVNLCMSIYQTLLKSHQNESRSMVIQCLDLMAPVLRKRTQGYDDQNLPVWARIPRKIVIEESGNLQQAMSIFNFFCRQPNLFFEARSQIAPTIVPHLQKISSLSNEGKRISLNLMNLIWDWEKRGYNERHGAPNFSPPRGVKRKQDGELAEHNIPWSSITNPQLRLTLVKHLTQFASHALERYPIPSSVLLEKFAPAQHPLVPSEFTRKAVHLLRKFISQPSWDDVDFASLIPRTIAPVLLKEPTDEEMDKKDKKEAWLTRTINTLQVLRTLVSLKSDEWVLGEIGNLSSYIVKIMKMPEPELQDCLHAEGKDKETCNTHVKGDIKDKCTTPLLRRMLQVLPPTPTAEVEEPEDTPAAAFLASVHAAINETMTAKPPTACVNLLFSLCQACPEQVDRYLPQITDILFHEELVSDHIAFQQRLHPPPTQPIPPSPGHVPITNIDLYEHEQRTILLVKVLDIAAARIDHLGNSRRPFLRTLVSTVLENSWSPMIISKIMDLAEGWIFRNDALPTVKEKVVIITKMANLEGRPELADLNNRFLHFILKIYEDPKIIPNDLTTQLEHPFLIGTSTPDIELRQRFLSIIDRHISRTPDVRLDALLNGQDWTSLGEKFWLSQVIDLLGGSIELSSTTSLHEEDFTTLAPINFFQHVAEDPQLGTSIIEDSFSDWMDSYKNFCNNATTVKLRDVFEPLIRLQHADSELAASIWIGLFPIFWSAIPKDERSDFEKTMTGLLAKDFHHRQLELRPSCIQTLVVGLFRASPRFRVPPHLTKFLAKTYNVWYPSLAYLETAVNDPLIDTPKVRESTFDALIDVYGALDESDMFYGAWRRRCKYVETIAAISFEQIGLWEKAQVFYESAQVKARLGVLSYAPGEYSLWEDHWVICAQKLQQWEILGDFAKHENLTDLYIESNWRNVDHWTDASNREQFESMILSVSDALTPLRAYFVAFMSYLKFHWYKADDDTRKELRIDFIHSIDEATHISIRKWHQLPVRVCNAHIPLLQNFQHLVELDDVLSVTEVLNNASTASLDPESQDLKSLSRLFMQWRERLPNTWDDINVWQNLVTWRTHVFTLVNQVFLPLIAASSASNQSNPAQYSYAYRGYHEQAWIINRFAHVARQHNLNEVSALHLNKIYTLPNIEIQEAFIKLREQAKCDFQKGELASGLDVINNTNLDYFSGRQKSEFYALKGMFYTLSGIFQPRGQSSSAGAEQLKEANDAFGVSMVYDVRLPKAWAEWARYHDLLFKKEKDHSLAAAAITCYLEAASLYKNSKCRKFLGRVLWLLGNDNQERICARQMLDVKADMPFWYWITYIPQLLLSLSRAESEIAKDILINIAKLYPQALLFQLRTHRENLINVKRQQELKEQELKARKEKQALEKQAQDKLAQEKEDEEKGQEMQENEMEEETKKNLAEDNTHISDPPAATPIQPSQANEPSTPVNTGRTTEESPRQAQPERAEQQSSRIAEKVVVPLDHVEEISSHLKNAHTLLFYSMEALAENVIVYLKYTPDQEAHRWMVDLLNDGINHIGRPQNIHNYDSKLPDQTTYNLFRFARDTCPKHVRDLFKREFVTTELSMREYIEKLRKWRLAFEERLERRQNPAFLESHSPMLIEFPFHRLDQVEVPGQYLEHKDGNSGFLKIDRFLPEIEQLRGATISSRRLKIRASDGSMHNFVIQSPTNRHCRREERIMQAFRMFNDTLVKKRESRRRCLIFNLPLTVPLNPSLRLVQDDPSNISLQGVYEDWCRKQGTQAYDPVCFNLSRLSEIARTTQIHNPPPRAADNKPTEAEVKAIELFNEMRSETFLAISERVPNTLVLKYFQSIYASFDDFYLFRRTFAYQLASLSFMNYFMFMTGRNPYKFLISQSTGKVSGTELYPTIGQHMPIFNNTDPVQFRFSPNLQMLIGPIATEGIFAPSMQVIARALTEPDMGNLGGQNSINGIPGGIGGTISLGEIDLEMVLCLYMRDEVNYWASVSQKALPQLAAQQEHKLGLQPGMGMESLVIESVIVNCQKIIKKATVFAKASDAPNLPANQIVVDQVSAASNPSLLATCDALWMAWL